MKNEKIVILLVLFLLNLNIVYASIGVGISPSKIFDKIESKQEKNYTFIIYNTGDIPLNIKLSSSDGITGIAKFYPQEAILQPEPEPHRLPPVNGKTITVTIKAPVERATKTIVGHVVATAGSVPGSSFGGSGAVASRVELEISPPKHIWDYLTEKQVIMGSIGVLLLIILVVTTIVMRKKGLKIAIVRER